MTKKAFPIIFILITCFGVSNSGLTSAHAGRNNPAAYLSDKAAFWVWTPETNKWINPKYAVKDTPQEQLQVGLDFYEMQEYKKAIREFEKLLKAYPRARQAPDAQFIIGKCYEDQGELHRAFKEYQVVVDKYPFSELSAEIVGKQYDIGLRLLDGEKKGNGFLNALSGNEYDVIDVFKAVIKNAPYGDLAAPAQYKIGLYLLEKRLYQEARDEFEKVINDYPGSEWAKAAKYQIATTDAQRSTGAEYDQKVTQAAIEEFNEFIESYPEAELSQEAKHQIQVLREKEAENSYKVAQFYEKQKNYRAAKIYYQAVVDDFGASSWSSQALNKIREMSRKE
jgi:outer membrane protein assembly factor BamD